MTLAKTGQVNVRWGDETPKVECSEIERMFDRLWPITRSITGNGVRETHKILSEVVPFATYEVPSGTQCYDWTVPQEWNVREAYIKGPDGNRFADVKVNNLHLVNYSIPFRGTLSRAELERHLHSIPDMPAAIPYVTSYYEPRWGFCITDETRRKLPDGQYEVVVDTSLSDGSMTISEAVLPGESRREVLFSTYTCHPSMANNELSGPLAMAFLYRRLAAINNRRLTYRFVFLPETIGSIAYHIRCGDSLRENVDADYVVTCVADTEPFTYKRSRRGNTLADRAAAVTLSALPGESRCIDFFPGGSDERQYCSPGFNLPVGVIARAWPGRYKEYHTSLDNRDFISFDALIGTIELCFEICRTIDRNLTYRNLFPFGEPQLGRRGLMSTIGAQRQRSTDLLALKWLLNLADGEKDMIGIAERSGIGVSALDRAAEAAAAAGLLATVA